MKLKIKTTESKKRKKITVVELGRICNLLMKSGLTLNEVAERLEISKLRVTNAMNKFREKTKDD